MDEISERALTLAAEVHDGARAPREALAPYRTALHAGFDEIATSVRNGIWPPPKLPRNDLPALIEDHRTLQTIAAETASVLAELERLEQTWQTSADR